MTIPGPPPRLTVDRGARTQAWVLVGLFFLILNGTGMLYAAADLEEPGGLKLLVAALSIVVFWRLLEAECRPYGATFPLDMGYFLYATSFLVLPYYFWRMQRWRGLGKLLVVAGLWAGSLALWYGLSRLLGLE
jgi:hypothetical protein